MPLLQSPLHARIAEKLVSLALRGNVEISSMPQVRVRESNKQRRSEGLVSSKVAHHPSTARPTERVEEYVKIIGVLAK